MATSQVLPIDPRLFKIPGMTSAEERTYLFHFARDEFSAEGEMVDLGSWLGSTAASLAAGLDQNKRTETESKKVCAYDYFRFDKDMAADFERAGLSGRYQQGDLFLDAFQDNVAPWANRVVPVVADLRTELWSGKNIEFLFVDAMKSWDLTNGILRGFFPQLIPGRSIVAHQDFAHFYTPWIHLLMFRLQEFLQPMRHIPSSGTVLFRSIKPIPSSRLQQTYSFDSFTSEETQDAFQWASEIVTGTEKLQVLAASVMAQVHQGRLTRAESLFADLLDQFGDSSEIADTLRQEIESPRFASFSGAATKHERAFCFQLAKQQCAGGAIAILGNRLDALIAALAEGMRQNPRAQDAMLHVFEINSPQESTGESDARPTSLHTSLVQNRSEWRERIVWHVDPDNVPSIQQPLDLLVLNCPTDADDPDQWTEIVQSLSQRLVPGRSSVLILEAPFLRDWNVAMTLDALCDLLTHARHVPHSSAAIFNCHNSPTSETEKRLTKPAHQPLAQWFRTQRRIAQWTLDTPKADYWRTKPWFDENRLLEMFQWRVTRQSVWRIESDTSGQIVDARFVGRFGDSTHAADWIGKNIDDWSRWASDSLDPVLPTLGQMPFPVLELAIEQSRSFQTKEPAQFVQLPVSVSPDSEFHYLLYAAFGPIDWSEPPQNPNQSTQE